MLDDRKRAEFEQSLAGINETLPAICWGVYTGCIKQGFNPVQSLLLVQSLILSNCSHGINGTSSQAPDIEPPEDDSPA